MGTLMKYLPALAALCAAALTSGCADKGVIGTTAKTLRVPPSDITITDRSDDPATPITECSLTGFYVGHKDLCYIAHTAHDGAAYACRITRRGANLTDDIANAMFEPDMAICHRT